MFLAAKPTEECSSAKASSACNLDAFEETADKKPSAWGAFYCDLAPAISAGSRQAKAILGILCPKMVLTRKVAAPPSPANHALPDEARCSWRNSAKRMVDENARGVGSQGIWD